MAAPNLPAEFDLIARYFAPLARGRAGAEGLTDDAAFLRVDPGMELVLTADALVAGVHFFADDSPDLIARKALRVNLSDLAAKGARPVGYLLTICLPAETDEAWLGAFCSGLAADQEEFDIALMGGDTTSTPGPLTLSITAFGEVTRGHALKRRGAMAGDAVLVTGTIGDAALGLRVRRGELDRLLAAYRQALLDRYRLPQPRVALGPLLAESGLVHAALDVSDGLLGDLGHICEVSGVGADIECARVPLSEAAAAALNGSPELMPVVLSGGDDYEILFTADPDVLPALEALAGRLSVPLAVVGHLRSGEGVRAIGPGGEPMSLKSTGFRHF